MERENIYRGGQLLAMYETGASCYKSIHDFVDAFYLSALGRAYNSSIDPAWKTTLTQAQGQLIVAAQSMGNSVFTSTEFNNHLPDTPENRGAFVTALYAAYLGRVPDGFGYGAWVAALNNGSSREEVRHGFAYSQEFQNDVGQLCVTMTNSGINYVLQDLQGSTRAMMNNGTYGSSAIVARHDYLPFGEEIWSGTGMRSSSQGYGTTDRNRQKYGLTERDDATGLDHTWWRKYESFSGRWTSPDPALASMNVINPQSFNRHSYVNNDPVNFVDPYGLCTWQIGFFWFPTGDGDSWSYWTYWYLDCSKSAGPGGGGGQESHPPSAPQQKKKKCPVEPLSEITDPGAWEVEDTGGTALDTQHLTEGTRNALNCLEGQVNSVGGSFALHSAYRPPAYQQHLREVWDKWQQLRNNNQSECQATKQAVQAEKDKHHLTEQPAGVNGPHVRGIAFDASVRLPARLPRGVSLGTMMSTCGVTQPRPGESGGHHFEHR